MKKSDFSKIMQDIKASVQSNAELVRDTAKARYALLQSERNLKKLLYELGALTYNAHRNGIDSSESAEQFFEAIEEKREEVDCNRRLYYAFCGKTECESCGKLVSVKYDFCPYCGEKIFADLDPDEADEIDEGSDDAQECSGQCEGCSHCDE